VTDLEVTRGDDRILDVTVPESITDALLTFTAKRRRRDPDDEAELVKMVGAGIEIVDGPGGLATISIDAIDTADLEAPLLLWWDLQGVDTDDKVNTLARGRLLIQPDITRATASS
jgi:hypothetical protein